MKNRGDTMTATKPQTKAKSTNNKNKASNKPINYDSILSRVLTNQEFTDLQRKFASIISLNDSVKMLKTNNKDQDKKIINKNPKATLVIYARNSGFEIVSNISQVLIKNDNGSITVNQSNLEKTLSSVFAKCFNKLLDKFDSYNTYEEKAKTFDVALHRTQGLVYRAKDYDASELVSMKEETLVKKFSCQINGHKFNIGYFRTTYIVPTDLPKEFKNIENIESSLTSGYRLHGYME